MEYHLTVSRADFVKELNKLRLANKNKWIFVYADVEGNRVLVKTYETYLQRYFVNGRQVQSGAMDMSITAWKQELERGIKCL